MNLKTKKYPPKVRKRTVRMAAESRSEHASQWAAIGSILAAAGAMTTHLAMAARVLTQT